MRWDSTRSYRYLGEVEVGAQYERDTDRNRLIGPSLSMQLPIFNQGQAAVLRAESLLDAARAQVRAQELEISNGVLAATDRVAAARPRVERLTNEMIPLREQIVARTQEQAELHARRCVRPATREAGRIRRVSAVSGSRCATIGARASSLAHAVGGAAAERFADVLPTSDAAAGRGRSR